MSEIDHALEDWIRRHQHWSDARLRKTVASKVHHCVDFEGALELLDRRDKDRRSEDQREAERRHKETMDEAARGIRFAKWAVVSAVIGVVVGIIGMSLPFVAGTPARTDAPLPATSSGSSSDPSSATAPDTPTQAEPIPSPTPPAVLPTAPTSPPPPK